MMVMTSDVTVLLLFLLIFGLRNLALRMRARVNTFIKCIFNYYRTCEMSDGDGECRARNGDECLP